MATNITILLGNDFWFDDIYLPILLTCTAWSFFTSFVLWIWFIAVKEYRSSRNFLQLNIVFSDLLRAVLCGIPATYVALHSKQRTFSFHEYYYCDFYRFASVLCRNVTLFSVAVLVILRFRYMLKFDESGVLEYKTVWNATYIIWSMSLIIAMGGFIVDAYTVDNSSCVLIWFNPVSTATTYGKVYALASIAILVLVMISTSYLLFVTFCTRHIYGTRADNYEMNICYLVLLIIVSNIIFMTEQVAYIWPIEALLSPTLIITGFLVLQFGQLFHHIFLWYNNKKVNYISLLFHLLPIPHREHVPQRFRPIMDLRVRRVLRIFAVYPRGFPRQRPMSERIRMGEFGTPPTPQQRRLFNRIRGRRNNAAGRY